LDYTILTKLDIAIRKAKKSKTRELILKAISIADIASKKKVLHKNKSARIKSQLSKFLPKSASKKVKKAKK
jgi:ribosomal protein S20